MDRPGPEHNFSDQFEAAIQLLRQIRVDYHHARKELHEVGSHFADREAAVAKQLRTALHAIDEVENHEGGRERASSTEALPVCGKDFEASIASLAEEWNRPTIEIHTLGRFQVRVGWNRVERWHSLKAKSLLKYLMGHQGRPVSRDVLMEALWPGCEPSLAGNNLKAAVRALRQTLGAAHNSDGDFVWVLYQDGYYMINSQAELWTDVEQFEYHWHAGRSLEKEGRLAEAVREHETAEALYRGDYLEDDPYEEWTSLRREALKDTYLAILGRLADYSVQNGDYEGCIVYCQKILTKDSCREDAYRRLMRCHSRLGQRNRAIAWYRICEKTIRAELDVSPDRQTVALYQDLMDEESI